jgi:hypothetical protein
VRSSLSSSQPGAEGSLLTDQPLIVDRDPASMRTFVVVADHSIQVENLTTIPYDVEVISVSLDADQGFFFCTNNDMQQNWIASFKSIVSLRPAQSRALVQKLGSNGKPRVQTRRLRYKRSIWFDWEEEEFDPILELSTARD